MGGGDGMSLREAAQAILDWLDAEEIWHPKQLSDDLRAALAEPEQEFVCSTGLCHYRRPLIDAALLAPEPGQLKDRGAK